MSTREFPAGFLWGVATSAFQVEGAAETDGRGESIWDRLAATPGRIEDGSDARVACANTISIWFSHELCFGKNTKRIRC